MGISPDFDRCAFLVVGTTVDASPAEGSHAW